MHRHSTVRARDPEAALSLGGLKSKKCTRVLYFLFNVSVRGCSLAYSSLWVWLDVAPERR